MIPSMILHWFPHLTPGMAMARGGGSVELHVAEKRGAFNVELELR